MATNDPGREGDGPEQPMAEKGGCLNLGWGCLPVLLLAVTLPGSLFL